MITIKKYNLKAEAELDRGLLEQSGIKSFVFADDEGGMNPSMSFVAGIELKVTEKDVESARKILNISATESN